jgi:hypothetical protein
MKVLPEERSVLILREAGPQRESWNMVPVDVVQVLLAKMSAVCGLSHVESSTAQTPMPLASTLT